MTNNYPQLSEHKADHDKFLDDFVEAIVKYENDPRAETTDEIDNNLRCWVLKHILTADKKLSTIAH